MRSSSGLAGPFAALGAGSSAFAGTGRLDTTGRASTETAGASSVLAGGGVGCGGDGDDAGGEPDVFFDRGELHGEFECAELHTGREAGLAARDVVGFDFRHAPIDFIDVKPSREDAGDRVRAAIGPAPGGR